MIDEHRPFHLEIAARTIWMEARGEGQYGMLAVACVISNRFQAAKWFSGETLAACVLYPEQFSCWNTGDQNRMAMAKVQDSDPALIMARECLTSALNDTGGDPTKGATHYYDVRMPIPPKWSLTAVKTVQIGHHVFFKNVL